MFDILFFPEEEVAAAEDEQGGGGRGGVDDDGASPPDMTLKLFFVSVFLSLSLFFFLRLFVVTPIRFLTKKRSELQKK